MEGIATEDLLRMADDMVLDSSEREKAAAAEQDALKRRVVAVRNAVKNLHDVEESALAW